MKINKLMSLAAMAAVMLTTSCNSMFNGGDDDQNLSVYQNIVSFVESSSDGMVFKLQLSDDSPTLTLLAKDQSINDLAAGQRIYLTYVVTSNKGYLDDTGKSINVINIQNASGTVSPAIEIAPLGDKYDEYANRVTVETCFRAGKWLNMVVDLAQSGTTIQANTLKWVTETAQPGEDGYYDLYLVYTPTDNQASYVVQTICTTNISTLWDDASCIGIRCHLPGQPSPTITTISK